jgi:hypothetical protein
MQRMRKVQLGERVARPTPRHTEAGAADVHQNHVPVPAGSRATQAPDAGSVSPHRSARRAIERKTTQGRQRAARRATDGSAARWAGRKVAHALAHIGFEDDALRVHLADRRPLRDNVQQLLRLALEKRPAGAAGGEEVLRGPAHAKNRSAVTITAPRSSPDTAARIASTRSRTTSRQQ